MPETKSLADIAARLKAIKREAEGGSDLGAGTGAPGVQARFIVATNWQEAAVPLAVLRAYLAAFSATAPVELCFAVPHEPGREDVECVRVLVEGVGGEAALGPLVVESFDEVLATPFDAAAVPSVHPNLTLTETAGLITRMFDVQRRLEAGRNTLPGGNQGDLETLQARLEAFAS